MRVIELRILNFKRLSRAKVRPTAAITPITGRNGAGKTSVLDAVSAVLGGMKYCPDVPIRQGEDRAEVVLELDEITITRRWTARSSSVEVCSKDGAVYKKPQEVLDRFVGPLCFDPLEFTRQKPLEQAATLARVAKIDLDAHRNKRATLFSDRATANKTAKELRAQAAGMPEAAGVPDEEADLTAFLEEVSAAEHAKKRREASEREHKAAVTDHALAQRRVEDLEAQLLEAKKKLSLALEEVHATKRALEDTPLPPDVDAIKTRGRQAEELNRRVRAKKARGLKLSDAEKLEALAKEISAKLDAHDAGLQEQLAKAALPVPGLSIGESGVTVGGIPFGQCSGAERLRVSVMIGLALNPRLKLMLIRDGSLLDDEGMRLLAELAEAADAQVLIERVSNGEAVGVRIVDGTTEGAVEDGAPPLGMIDDRFPVA